MKKFLCFLLLLCHFSIANASAPWDIFSIDMSKRGQDFTKALTTAFTLAGANGEVVIQTMANPPYRNANGVVNGIIPFVQNASTTNAPITTFPQVAPHSTLFVFAYNPNKSKGILNNITQFLVVGIEQIVTLAYRDTIVPPFSLSRPFTSAYASNVYPLYFIDPVLRAADIQSICKNFLTNPQTYFGNTTLSELWIWTTLSGDFYDSFATSPPYPPGLIPKVTAVTVLSNSLLQIFYQPQSPAVRQVQPQQIWSVIVAAEQVQQITFYPNGPPGS